MILGMSVPTFTLLHVIISLIGIATGVVVVLAMVASRTLPRWTDAFLLTTVLTSVTGFLFHSKAIGPPHIVGAISLVVLAFTIYGLYSRKLWGAWRAVFVVGAVLALYLNAFVGVVQAFQKIAPLHVLAPTGTEGPFVVAQGAVLLIFVALGFLALRRYRSKR